MMMMTAMMTPGFLLADDMVALAEIDRRPAYESSGCSRHLWCAAGPRRPGRMTAIRHRLPNRPGHDRGSPPIHNMFGALAEFERLKPLLRVIHKRVGACLRNYRGKGLVRASDGPGRTVLWEIIR
jgi:hypothetical protein